MNPDTPDMFQRALDDQGYLDLVSGLSFDGVTWDAKSITAVRDLLAPWNHNIRLGEGIYTAYWEDPYPEHQEIMSILNQAVSGDFEGKRILDIGCLEGYFSAECALQGADVLGIDGRLINLKKCEFVKSVLDIDNLRFVQDDALAVTQERYGSFDVVLALGLLYHLDDPFSFLENLSRLSRGFVLIDTLVALEEPTETIGGEWKPELSTLEQFSYRGNSYTGRRYREFESDATQLGKDLSPTASLENEHSIWLTESSLIQLLRDVGFEQVEKLVYGRQESLWWADVERDSRVLCLAVKSREPFHSKIFAP
jgi:SAM-dependent methyltransferase